MGKIFCIMGKSSSGKDTIYGRLLKDKNLNLKHIITYTTRPIREGETNGNEYYFIDDAKVEELEAEGKILEIRAYHTVHGIWKYMTVADGTWDVAANNYVIIGTPESYEKCLQHFGKDVMVPIYVTVEDGLRLERALKRERAQKEPKYEEMCRRFLADAEDFKEENIRRAGIEKRFENNSLEECYGEIAEYIKGMLE